METMPHEPRNNKYFHVKIKPKKKKKNNKKALAKKIS